LYTERNDSLVTKYWRGLTVSAGTCSHPECTHVTRAFNVFDIYTIPPGAKTLTAFLAEETRPQDPNVLKWKCEVCEADGRGRQLRKRRVMFCRLPDRLMLPIQRFNRALQKDRSRLEFPLRDLDMGPYCMPSSERGISDSDPDASNIANNDHHFRPPFKYDLYAVICHVGRQLKSGHYVAYVRDQDSDDPTAWIKFNDIHADAVRIYPGSDILDFLYGNGKCDEQAYLLFYQRQGT
jgi:ubiquitin carboxyl-terminal hydrolase 8